MPPSAKHALRAMLFGSLAGGGPFMLITVAIAFESSSNSLTETLALLFMPLLIAAAIVVPAFLLIGLPLTALYRRQNMEKRRIYGFSGLITGLLVPFAIVTIIMGELGVGFAALLSLPGALAGFITGFVWGGWRESLGTFDTDALSREFE